MGSVASLWDGWLCYGLDGWVIKSMVGLWGQWLGYGVIGHIMGWLVVIWAGWLGYGAVSQVMGPSFGPEKMSYGGDPRTTQESPLPPPPGSLQQHAHEGGEHLQGGGVRLQTQPGRPLGAPQRPPPPRGDKWGPKSPLGHRAVRGTPGTLR